MKKQGYYCTKSLLPSEGRLQVTIKVNSRFGETIEKGSSQSLNVRTDRKFLLSKCITQAIFGHLKKLNKNSYEHLNSNSGDENFIDNMRLSIKVIDYYYCYPKFNGIKRYKIINFKGKRYVQEWTKKNNRYVYSARTKVKYDNRNRLTKLSKDFKMV